MSELFVWTGVAELERVALGLGEDTQAAVPARPLADGLLEPLARSRGCGRGCPGAASMTVRSGAGLPSKSGMRTSTPMSGATAFSRRIVSAKMWAPPSAQVVAGDAGDDDVLEPEGADRLGDPSRFVLVVPGGPAGLHGAEAARPGARVAEDHDRRGALVPALPDVRAAGLLAHRVEVRCRAAGASGRGSSRPTGCAPGSSPDGAAAGVEPSAAGSAREPPPSAIERPRRGSWDVPLGPVPCPSGRRVDRQFAAHAGSVRGPA